MQTDPPSVVPMTAIQPPSEPTSSGAVAKSPSETEATAPGSTSQADASLPDVDQGYAWVVSAASFMVHFFVLGIQYTIGLFVVEYLVAFPGTTRAEVSWLATVPSALMLGMGVFTGKAVDRFGMRAVCGAGSVLICGALVLSSTSTEIWQLTLFSVLLGIGFSMSFVPAITSVTLYFERLRGVGTGIGVSGSGVGTLALSFITAQLISTLGWRPALLVLGFMALAGIALSAVAFRYPAHIRTVREQRRSARVKHGVSSESEEPSEQPSKKSKSSDHDEIGVQELLQDPVVVCFLLSGMIGSIGYLTPFVHLARTALDIGATREDAAALLSVMGACSTLGRIILGYGADRFTTRLRMMVFSLSVMGLATMTLWAFANHIGLLFAFAVLYGIFGGAYIALIPPLVAEYLGVASISTKLGTVYVSSSLGTLIGPVIFGGIIDATGQFVEAALVAGASLILCAAGIAALPWAKTKRKVAI